MKNIPYIFLTIFAVSACGPNNPKTDVKPILEVPTVYTSANYTANVATETALKLQLKALVDKIKTGRTTGTVITYNELNALYTAGSPSLKSITTPYYDILIVSYMRDLAQASGTTFVPSATISGQGGTFDGTSGSTYLFDEHGIEPEQLIEKGLFGAALYNYVLSLTKNISDANSVDKIIEIYGSNPVFSNSTKLATGFVPETNVALYAARRTDVNDANGLYFKIKNNILKLQKALQMGSQFATERDEAIAEIKINLEKALIGTVINYCKDGVSKLSTSTVSSINMAKALHSLSEAVGFLHGLKGISAADKKITDAQIDEILVLLGAKPNQNADFNRYATESVAKVADLITIQSKLKAIYEFSDAEMTNFGTNYIETQNRK